MPTYEYMCQKCNGLFNVILSMAEHGRGGVTCPDCGSNKVVQQFSVFYAKTSKKS
jgi:putative FmdB family regulatory protein